MNRAEHHCFANPVPSTRLAKAPTTAKSPCDIEQTVPQPKATAAKSTSLAGPQKRPVWVQDGRNGNHTLVYKETWQSNGRGVACVTSPPCPNSTPQRQHASNVPVDHHGHPHATHGVSGRSSPTHTPRSRVAPASSLAPDSSTGSHGSPEGQGGHLLTERYFLKRCTAALWGGSFAAAAHTCKE